MNNRIIYIGLGAVVGGIGGYLLADLIAWKILEAEFEEELRESEDEVEQKLFVGLRDNDKPRVDYSKYAKEELKTLAEPYQTEHQEPYIISFDSWQENAEVFEDYDREVVSYYAEDQVFADEGEAVIDKPSSLFGPNIHLHFGEESEDPDVVYVVNPSEGIMYEIVQQHESYSVQVLGETPPEPAKKRGRPRKKPVESSNDD